MRISSPWKRFGRDGRLDLQRDRMLVQPVGDQFGRGGDRLLDADLGDVELHDAGVDGGEVENVVDDGEQHRRRRADMLDIFALARRQRPGRRQRQQLGEADDVGQRRAQLVGDVLDEIVLQLVGLLQRLVLLLQRPLDVDAVGDVDEGHHHLAVGQVDDRVAQHRAVDQFGLAVAVAALVVEAGDGGDEARPRAVLGQRLAARPDRRICAPSARRCRRTAATARRRPGSTAGCGRPARTRRRLRPDCRASRPARAPPSCSGFRDPSSRSGSRTPR